MANLHQRTKIEELGIEDLKALISHLSERLETLIEKENGTSKKAKIQTTDEDTNMDLGESTQQPEDDFTVPTRACKRKTKEPETPIETQNKYNSLRIEEDEVESDKPTPVVLREPAKWTALNKSIAKKKIQYVKARTTHEGIRISPQTIDDHRQLTKLMDEEKIPYHTFTFKSEKTLKVVLRGICNSITEEEIKADLEEVGYPTINVTRLLSKDKKPMPLIQVELERKYHSIYKRTNLCGLEIKVEALKNKTNNGQCHRCQMYGHIQAGCKADYRCLKCAGNHSTHLCQKPKTLPAKCANCNGPHPANHIKCPKNPKYQQEEKTTQQSNAAQQKTPENLPKEYSAAVKKISAKEEKTPTDSHQSTNAILGDMMIQFSSTNPTEEQYQKFLRTITNLIKEIKI